MPVHYFLYNCCMLWLRKRHILNDTLNSSFQDEGRTSHNVIVPRLELLSALLLLPSHESCLHVSEIECYNDFYHGLALDQRGCEERKQLLENWVSEIHQKTHSVLWNTSPKRQTLLIYLLEGWECLSCRWAISGTLGQSGWSLDTLKVHFPKCWRSVQWSWKRAARLSIQWQAENLSKLLDHFWNAEDSAASRDLWVMVYVLRAVRYLKSKQTCQVRSLSNEELHDAECQWIRDFQVNLSGEQSFET